MNFQTRVVVFLVMLLIVAAMWGVTFVTKRFERVAEGVASIGIEREEGMPSIIRAQLGDEGGSLSGVPDRETVA